MPVHAEQKEEGAVAAVKKGMALLDRHLTKNTYLVGHTATLADIVGVCNLYHGYTKVRSCLCLHMCCKAALNVEACCSGTKNVCVSCVAGSCYHLTSMERWFGCDTA